jgi:hypothetical protein
MAKQYFLQRSNEGKATTFEQFRDNIPPYVALFNLAAADITQQAADATYYREILTLAKTMGSAGQQWTAWKGTVLTGTTGTEPAIPAKHAGFPAAVPVGILARFLALVNAIKNHKNYTPEAGLILGIEGEEHTGPDLTTIQPDFDVNLSGNAVSVNWGWGGNGNYLDMVRLEKDSGDGKGFQFLANDTTPGYTDSTPFPATPTKWTYRAIYIVGDAQVGIWSKSVSIVVGG